MASPDSAAGLRMARLHTSWLQAAQATNSHNQLICIRCGCFQLARSWLGLASEASGGTLALVWSSDTLQGVALLPGEVWQASCRYLLYFQRYFRKQVGGLFRPVSQNCNLAWVSEWKIRAPKRLWEWKIWRKICHELDLYRKLVISVNYGFGGGVTQSLMPNHQLRVRNSNWISKARVENCSPMGVISHPNQPILGHWFRPPPPPPSGCGVTLCGYPDRILAFIR